MTATCGSPIAEMDGAVEMNSTIAEGTSNI